MKKCTLILMVILTIVACKKEKEDSTAVATETSDSTFTKTSDSISTPNCITLEGYYTSADSKKKAEWVKQRGDSVCPCTLEESVLATHRVKGTVTNQKEKYVISWGKLKNIIKNYGYDKYLRLEVNNKKQEVLGVSMVPDYENGTYSFSTALIRSLAKRYVKNDNAEFHFSFAILDKSVEPAVVIQVNDPSNRISVNEIYFDYSTDPSKKDKNPKLNIPL
ncbi:hypothetical protein ACFFLS_01680 [Flavobacterium procerum]|uniref:Uncharacterized protein n=1 Tax=Flavobacterium procerum TaxID=1455569 RepID=A0ABV6BJZ7_9FLAO